MMKKKFYLILLAFITVAVVTLYSCAGGDNEHARYIVINELMPTNRTGIQPDNQNPADWIEIKNTGKDSVNLKGFKIVVTKDYVAVDEAKSDSLKPSAALEADDDDMADREEGEKKKEKKKVKKWKFPSVNIGAGECLVVFAGKKDSDAKEGNALFADLKLPKRGATVQLLAPNGNVLSEIKYGAIEPDQSLALQPDSTFKATFWQSPGFENNREGYEAASKKIDGQRQDPLRIWELMSRAGHSYENWVELKNVGDRPINLSDYSLSKKMGKEEGWKLPARSLAPGQIVSVKLLGGRAKSSDDFEAPFKLGDKETILLSKDGKFVDGICARLTPYGGSIGRQTGDKGFFFFASPSPGVDNGNTGLRYIAENPQWDRKPGVYTKEKQMSIRLDNPGRKVHYTLDGSEPTLDSPVFKDSILLTKPTVVRSFAEGDSVTMSSNIATHTYLIGVDHDLPVINISLDKKDFYDHSTGIYADGPGYGGEFPYQGANFWKNWTKKAHVELFDGNDGFASDCGLKIFGGYSRALQKKSLRIKFRGEFGDAKVNYDFFGNGQPLDIEDLVLRSGSQDYSKYMIRDEFFTSLAARGCPSLLIQMYRPVAVYVNAEYFGLYYLREKVDKNFVARKLGLPNDSIDIYLSGPSPYKELEAKISKLDMSKNENFEFARKNIDFESLIDYKISNIFTGKWDTGNIRYVRSRHPDSDGKWRFVYYDIDASWSMSSPRDAAFSLSTDTTLLKPEKVRHNVLIAALLRNPEFRQMFLERLSYHLNNTYSVKTTTAHFDKFISQIKNEMKQNCERWPVLTYPQWEKNISNFRAKLLTRPQIILNDLRTYLHVTDAENKKYFAQLGY